MSSRKPQCIESRTLKLPLTERAQLDFGWKYTASDHTSSNVDLYRCIDRWAL